MKYLAELPNALETALYEYMVLSSSIKTLEEKQKIYRDFILAKAAKLETSKLQAGEFIASVAEVERENFNLKVAKEFLGDKLNPFITKAKYPRLTVKRGVLV